MEDPARNLRRVSGRGGGSPRGFTLPVKTIRFLYRRIDGVGFVQVVKMEEEQSSESDGYYTHEEEPVCSKPEGTK